ncbi:MAG TPA: efflux RND transporter permease subunit [Deltaproteobacteria bacterium]|nr:efflux RND transporter permease subunit [Deltaproteobacteria bacterium]HPR55822.1 efflux RND transporter permease subunit [Deltaproteobacteria bacterium]HXK47709.1 efflux RND transporter permease subunit [Deltaproteobacteria bacterium]
MNISSLFIRRPVMTTLVMLSFLVFGIVAYRALPVSELPNVDFPTIRVSASLPGASPETMASSVATTLESEFSNIAGIDSMTSTSSQGSTQITLQFKLNRDIDAAAQDVQAAISAATHHLPQDMDSPPSFRKVNPAESPIFFIALSSATLPLSTVDEYAENLLAKRISMIDGVAEVSVFGSQKYAVRVQVDPKALSARSVGIDEVIDAIQSGNVNLPTGTLWGKDKAYTIQSSGQLDDAAAYRPLIVAYRDGSPIRLGDLGRVIDSVENNKSASWFNDERSIILAVNRQPGTNTVEVVQAVRDILPGMRNLIPASVNLSVLYDRSQSIKDSIRDVQLTLLLALALVVLVIFLFLRNLSATIIPSLALPMSIVGTFAVMYLAGFNLDNLSLMALTLCVGFVVDDAIVMLENIVRHMEQGRSPLEAAFSGSKEISFTIISMTLSLVAVFIPVLFMGGIVGRLLHEFAVTIAVAVLISGLVSLSLTPMLCSIMLRSGEERSHGRTYQASERIFEAMRRGYEASLRLVMHHRLVTLGVSIIFLVGVVYLYFTMPKGFLPGGDTGMVTASTEAAQGTSFESMVNYQKKVARIIQSDPDVDVVMSSVGRGSSNTGNLMIRLKPLSDRVLNADEVIQKLRPKLAAVPGIQVYLQNPPPIRIGGYQTKSQYQYTLQSPDIAELYHNAPLLQARLDKLPGFQDVTSDLQLKNPQVSVSINRDKASALGLSLLQIEQALGSAYSSRQVSTIYAPNNDYQVILELDPQYQTDPSALALLYIRASTGQLIPLSTVASLAGDVGPLSVNHLGQLPSVTLSYNLAPGKALGDAVGDVEKTARAILPDTITGSPQGTAQAFESSMTGLGVLILVAILVIYIVLGILYESFIHPLTILSGLPSAGIGALVTLMIFGVDLNLYALVGVIMLIGIVKKNAIMMIDFALDAERKEGKKPEEAIFQGALIRFRPIMMTTMAALMATLPIALGLGAGGESRRPLGLAVVGGLVFSQIVTLYITPVTYIYLDAFQTAVRRYYARFRRA